MNKTADELKTLTDTPEVIAALERAALRDFLAQIERGELDQLTARRQTGDIVALLEEDVRQRAGLLQDLRRVHFTLTTKQNYMESMRANYEAKQARGEG